MSALLATDLFPLGRGAATYKVTWDDLLQGAVVVSPTAPASPTSGRLWLDTTQDTFKIWDGTKWISTASSLLIDGGSATSVYTSVPNIDGGAAA
jgi:hypothetical protein